MDEWLDLGELVERVQELMDIGLYDDAQELLVDYEDTYGSYWEIPFLRARILIELGKPGESISWFQQSLKIDEHNPDSLLGLFYAYSQTGNTPRGAPFLLKAAEIEPDGEPVLSALIWYYTELSDYDKALGFFAIAKALPPENPETWRNAGIAYQRLGKNSHAEECLRNAMELSPDGDEERDMLADQYVMTGKTADAVGLYQDLLSRSPRNVRALSRLAFSLVQDERAAEAEKTAQTTIEYYPNSTTGYVDLAFVYLSSGKSAEALETAEKALVISPIDSEVMRVKGIALSEIGRDGESTAAFRKALDLDPENSEIKRDFYHHLRHTGAIDEMERLAHEVIHEEQPYCVEDCWFLADYYREKNNNLKAFQYLRRALRFMPGERELMPPLIDIMIENNHLLYSAGFLFKYVKKTGWNDTMNNFARHTRLKGKLAQESIRFLRFYSERGAGYNAYIFVLYFRKAFVWGGALLFLPLTAILISLFSWWSLGLVAGLYGLGYLVMQFAVRRVTHVGKITLPKAKLQETVPTQEHLPPTTGPEGMAI